MIKEINIPTGWKEVKLGEVCKIKHGKSQKNVECSNGKYPILASGGLIGYANDFLYDKESVLIGRKGTIDKPQYMNTPFWTVDTLFYTEVKDNSFAKWLFYHFSYIKWKKYNEGSTVPSLTGSGISNIKILLPPLPEQEAIANILEKWDEAIEKTAKLIEAKTKKFEWLKNSLFDKAQNDNWKRSKLSNIAKVKKGKQLNRSELEDFGDFPAWNGGISPSGYTEKWNTLENNITISEGGNSCGFVNYCEQKFWCGGHCYAILDVDDNVDPIFLYFFLKSKEKRIMRLRVGSGLPNIQKSDIDKLEIRYPEILEQKQVSKTLSTAKKEITILEEILAKYKSQKKGLMQKLLTGKIRVNNINSIN